MRLKHFIAEVAKLDGWFLSEGEMTHFRIRRSTNDGCQCPLTAVWNSKLGSGQRQVRISEFADAALGLRVTAAVASASDDEPHRSLNAKENINELRRHLLKATKLAPA